jgi:hypothetical protein
MNLLKLLGYLAAETASILAFCSYSRSERISFFSPRWIWVMHDSFEVLEEIGTGAFGKIHKVVRKSDQKVSLYMTYA